MENKFIHTIKSIGLCIKYPFLYPRNRFTALHYTSWKLHNYLYGTGGLYNIKKDGLRNKAFVDEYISLDFPDPDGSRLRHIHHIKNYGYAIWFYIVEFIYKYIVPFFHCIPTYTEWDAIPAGWNKAFGKQMLKELGDAVHKLPKIDRRDFRIMQIKEKYGSLQVYTNYGTNEIYDVLAKYEDLSYRICIDCGKHATKLTGGYILPYCDECFAKNSYYDEPYLIMKNGEWVNTQWEQNDDK